MKHASMLATAAFAFLVVFASAANGYVVFKPLSGKNIGDTSYWPTDLKELVLHHECVAGQEFVAPSWGRGVISAQLCFAGSQRDFNKFLKGYAEVKHDALVLTLHPGKGAFHGGPAKSKEPVPFTWLVTVSTNGLFQRGDGVKPTTHLSVEYHLGERPDLLELEVPAAIEVRAGYDDKYRQAHKNDPSVKAIDTFVRSRQAPR
jgi:hypothetical protein